MNRLSELNSQREYARKRLSSLLETNKYSDCCFVFDNDKLFAHKIILASASAVFGAMFFGSLASSEIKIEDIDAAEFRQMLIFIYTDFVHITSVANAWSLVYIAKKYLMEDLLDFCMDYIGKNLQISNTLLNYEYSSLYSESSVREHCLRVMKMYTNIVLGGDYHMKASTLCDLLDQDEFNAQEQDVIRAAIKWALVECEQQGLDRSPDNVRRVLRSSGALSRLRFLALPLEDMSPGQQCCRVLRADEVLSLAECKRDGSARNRERVGRFDLSLNAKPRRRVPLSPKLGCRRVLKFCDVFRAGAGATLTTQVAANKRVLVSGFVLPARRAPELCPAQDYLEDLRLTVRAPDGRRLHQCTFSERLTYGSENSVRTAEPLVFEEGQKYLVDVTWAAAPRAACDYTLHYLTPSFTHTDLTFHFDDPCGLGLILGLSYCV